MPRGLSFGLVNSVSFRVRVGCVRHGCDGLGRYALPVRATSVHASILPVVRFHPYRVSIVSLEQQHRQGGAQHRPGWVPHVRRQARQRQYRHSLRQRPTRRRRTACRQWPYRLHGASFPISPGFSWSQFDGCKSARSQGANRHGFSHDDAPNASIGTLGCQWAGVYSWIHTGVTTCNKAVLEVDEAADTYTPPS